MVALAPFITHDIVYIGIHYNSCEKKTLFSSPFYFFTAFHGVSWSKSLKLNWFDHIFGHRYRRSVRLFKWCEFHLRFILIEIKCVNDYTKLCIRHLFEIFSLKTERHFYWAMNVISKRVFVFRLFQVSFETKFWVLSKSFEVEKCCYGSWMSLTFLKVEFRSSLNIFHVNSFKSDNNLVFFTFQHWICTKIFVS